MILPISCHFGFAANAYINSPITAISNVSTIIIMLGFTAIG